MKKLLLLLSLLSPSAFACFDPAFKPLTNPEKALLDYRSNSSFDYCLAKLERDGVNLGAAMAWRKERPAGDEGPVVYTVRVQGQNRQDEPTWLEISYDLSRHAFTCGEISHVIYRCFQ